ncbi:MAG TPA: S1C family serine protease [Acidimicrobiales bacterium]|jgi:S1-C subfamily serine protease
MASTTAAPTAAERAATPKATGWISWRNRLLPRTVLGMSVLILFTALGAAFSGAVLFAYYQFRLDQNEASVTSLLDEFDGEVGAATSEIASAQEEASERIRQELEPLQRIAASGETLDKLLQTVAPSMWFVVTRDSAGQPSVGSAFVVASDAEQSFLLTSYTTVEALTKTPAPALKVRQDGEELDATLWTWEEGRDLALLVVRRGGQPALAWATASPSLGDRVFVISGLGAAGAAVTQGAVADISSSGIQHDAAVGHAFQGGPVVTASGEVLGVASRSYAPLGFLPGAVTFAVPIDAACDQVLRCPSGSGAAGGGDRR